MWCANGEMFYIANGRLQAVSVEARGNTLEISKPTELFELPSDAFDVAADGQTVFTLRADPEERLSLIFEWPSELSGQSVTEP